MNKRISDWSVVNNYMHRVLIVFSVPMLLLILWQLYSSDKVAEAMRGNDLSFGVFFYFVMIAIEIDSDMPSTFNPNKTTDAAIA